MYLQFVEPFGKVPVDYRLARDGLSAKEIARVEQDRPPIIDITNLFVQALTEFEAAARGPVSRPPPNRENFRGMAETLFHQRQVKNDLARRNMLAIEIGSLLYPKGDGTKGHKTDIGIGRRDAADKPLLLYDRDGNAVRGFGAPLDTEYRTIDLAKLERDTGLPRLGLQVENRAIYSLLRSMERQLGEPLHEVEALAASLYQFSHDIAHEIHQRYNGEIADRLVAMAPVVILFFVLHAVAAHLIATGNPAGPPLMVLLKAAGWIFGIDFALINLKRLAEAGRHFQRMELLHRTAQGEKAKLTKLSERHLTLGARALLDAMADFIAMGVLIGGSYSISRFGPALAKGVKKALAAKSEARVKLNLEDGVVTSIEQLPQAVETNVKLAVKKEQPTGELQSAQRKVGGEPAEAYPIESAAAPVEGQKATPIATETLTVRRPRALDQSPAEFAKDVAAQRELFAAAKGVLPRQTAVMQEVLDELGIKDAEVKSILKRDSPEEFTKTSIEKVRDRKKRYKTMGEMTDMVRGRANLEDPAQVERVARKLRDKMTARAPAGDAPKVQEPLERVGVEDGYPRWHVDVVDPETGIRYEWQIGTKATTRLYEQAGIDVGGLKIEPGNRNIHDIEYDIFKSIQEPGCQGAGREGGRAEKVGRRGRYSEVSQRGRRALGAHGSRKDPASRAAKTDRGASPRGIAHPAGVGRPRGSRIRRELPPLKPFRKGAAHEQKTHRIGPPARDRDRS